MAFSIADIIVVHAETNVDRIKAAEHLADVVAAFYTKLTRDGFPPEMAYRLTETVLTAAVSGISR